LDREAERERERQREKEIRAFREFSTKLPLKPTAAPVAITNQRRSRNPSFGDQMEPPPMNMMPMMKGGGGGPGIQAGGGGGGMTNWSNNMNNPSSLHPLQPVNPHAALLNPLNNDSERFPTGMGMKGGGGGGGVGLMKGSTPTNVLHDNMNNMNESLGGAGPGPRKTPRTLVHLEAGLGPGPTAQPPNQQSQQQQGMSGLRSRGGARPQPAQLLPVQQQSSSLPQQWEREQQLQQQQQNSNTANRPPFLNQRTPPQMNYLSTTAGNAGRGAVLGGGGGGGGEFSNTGFSPRFPGAGGAAGNGFSSSLEPPPSRQRGMNPNYLNNPNPNDPYNSASLNANPNHPHHSLLYPQENNNNPQQQQQFGRGLPMSMGLNSNLYNNNNGYAGFDSYQNNNNSNSNNGPRPLLNPSSHQNIHPDHPGQFGRFPVRVLFPSLSFYALIYFIL
jgi:hypothetical protein